MANMARQRSLTVASASTVVCSSITETSAIVSPAHTVLSHSTPVSYPTHRAAAGGGTQQQIPDVRLNTPSEYQQTNSVLWVFMCKKNNNNKQMASCENCHLCKSAVLVFP